jgi:hypothetical protein
MRYIWAILIWVGIIPVAILNGGLRQYVLDVYCGSWSSPLSGLILALCIYFVAMWLVTKIKNCRRADYSVFGLIWFLLTNLFDLTMILRSGGEISAFLQMYDVMSGNLWIIVVASALLSPILAGRKAMLKQRNDLEKR